MCGRFETLTRSEAEGAAQAILTRAPYNYAPDWPATRPADAFPRRLAPIIRSVQQSGVTADATANTIAGASLEVAEITWGYIPDGHRDLVFNTRIETAASTHLWADSLKYRRCVVPATAFFERHSRELGISPTTGKAVKQLYRFYLPQNEICLMAGVWEGERFSVITQPPNDVVRPVHNRMPLLLASQTALDWITEGASILTDSTFRSQNTRLAAMLASEAFFAPAPKNETPPDTNAHKQAQLSLF
jgi:putative SOS response-associated peptidase YedK